MVGLLFFGVPNRGMDIESLQSIVGNRQNRYLLESLGQYSDLLLQQDGQFGAIFHFEDSPVVSFFETKSSPTAVKVNLLLSNTELQLLKSSGEQCVEDGRSEENPRKSLLSNSPPSMGVRG